jgi:hypothetical protein
MVSKAAQGNNALDRLDYFYRKELALLVLTKQISLKKEGSRHEETDYSSEDSVLILIPISMFPSDTLMHLKVMYYLSETLIAYYD